MGDPGICILAENELCSRYCDTTSYNHSEEMNLRSGVICENISIPHLIKCMERREMRIMISMNNSVKD